MNRSIYSLLLMDDVIRAVDQLAYAQNTSRSNTGTTYARYF